MAERHVYPIVQDLLLNLYSKTKNNDFSDRQFLADGHARYTVSFRKIPTLEQNEKDRAYRAHILSLSKVFKQDLKEALLASHNEEEVARVMLQRGQIRMLEHVDKEATMRILRHRAEEAKEQEGNVLDAKELQKRKEQLDVMTKDAENERSRITQGIATSQKIYETRSLMLLSNIGENMREGANTDQTDVTLLDPKVVPAQAVELDRTRHVVAEDTHPKVQRVSKKKNDSKHTEKKKHKKTKEATEQDMCDEDIEFVSMTHSEQGVPILQESETSIYVNSSGASPHKAHAIPKFSSEASPHANVYTPTLDQSPDLVQSPSLVQSATLAQSPALVQSPVLSQSSQSPSGAVTSIDNTVEKDISLSDDSSHFLQDVSNNAPLHAPLHAPQMPIGVWQQGFKTRGSSYKPPSQKQCYRPSSRSCPPTSFNRVQSSSNSNLPSQIFQSKGPAPAYTPVYSKWVVSKNEGELVMLRSNEKLPSFGFTSSVTDNSFDMSRIEPGEPFRVYNEKKQLMSCFVGFKLTHVTTDQYHRIVDFSILDKIGNPVKYMRC